jgi:hypothetical protein
MASASFKKYAVLHILWIYIASVAVYDLFRCLHDGSVFLEMEMNPTVRWLYGLLNENLIALCVVKFWGSCICMTILLAIRRGRLATPIFLGVAGVQTAVLLSYCPFLSPF